MQNANWHTATSNMSTAFNKDYNNSCIKSITDHTNAYPQKTIS